MIRTRCKFQVVGVEDTNVSISRLKKFVKANTPDPDDGSVTRYDRTEYEPTGKYMQNIRLAAIYDTTKQEDLNFAQATPSGELKIYVNNPAVVGQFKPGEYYYIDIVPCENS